MVGLTGLEPVTPALSRQCSNQLSYRPGGGGERTRTDDPLNANQVLYQLSYTPLYQQVRGQGHGLPVGGKDT